MLRGERVELADCVSQPLQVPAEAEIVHRGRSLARPIIATKAPIGDHTGYYNAVEQFPVFTVTAITMRREPDLSFDLHRPAAGRALACSAKR